jgi:membrane dipeptidase
MRFTRRTLLGSAAGAALTAGALAERRAEAGPLSSDNEVIQKARQAALAVLQPSDRDIEHGLELHAASIVFDSYGFSPRAALDGAAYPTSSCSAARATPNSPTSAKR